MMKAIVLEGFGSVENLRIREMDIPEPGAGEVLLAVKAISINQADILQRLGKDLKTGRSDMPLIPGWDVSGVVKAAGAEVISFKPGDEVFGMIRYPLPGGTYAEYVSAPAMSLTRKPAAISHEAAAAATMSALTAATALIDLGDVRPGQEVLISGATDGTGHYAIQIAKHLGAQVYGISALASRDFIISLGADLHFDWGDINRRIAAGMLVDFGLDNSGGNWRNEMLQMIRWGGTMVDTFPDPRNIFPDTAAYRGIRGFSDPVRPGAAGMERIAGLLGSNAIKSHIFRTFDLDQMADAHSLAENGAYHGKIVLKT
ncbi:NADP-dependent oxidoreductase [Mucilaginibacter angelicae]|uniref:NADP-dependent oxidoreductase n=1 Tax=Mucilaginibacter angelicae TaxID=869718 RepID=A0ABV6L042_9SPHI